MYNFIYMNSKINSDIENVINESIKKDRIYLGLFVPVIIICLIIQSVSLVSGIILRQDPFLIIVFILISLVFLFSLTCLIHYFLIPQQQVKIQISTKIVEFCRVFEIFVQIFYMNFLNLMNIKNTKFMYLLNLNLVLPIFNLFNYFPISSFIRSYSFNQIFIN